MIGCSIDSIIQSLLFTSFAFSITECLCLIYVISITYVWFSFSENPQYLLEIRDKDCRKKVSKPPVHNCDQKDSTSAKSWICLHTFHVKDKGISTRFYHAFVSFFFFFNLLINLWYMSLEGQIHTLYVLYPYLFEQPSHSSLIGGPILHMAPRMQALYL